MDDMTIERVREEVRRLDPALSDEDEAFGAAMVLLSLLTTRPWSVPHIARFTELPRSFVAEVLGRLRDNGVIQRSRLAVEWAEGGEDSGIAFWMDVGVAIGWLRRAPAGSAA